MFKIKIMLFAALLVLFFSLSACSANDLCSHANAECTTVEASCNTEGYVLNKCPDCASEFKTNVIPPKGHTLKSHTVSSTCTEQGYTEYSCDCGYTYKADFTSPLGHSLALKLTAPTCTEQGYTDFNCSNCSYAFRAAYEKPLGHDLTSTRTAPTSFTAGTAEHFCDCGYEYTENIVPTELYKGAYVEGTEIVARGIDVSKWQETVNWEEIKAAGIDFVIIRAGYSTGKDPYFEENYAGAKAVGLDVGCYYYTYATSPEEILADAEEFLSFIEGKTFEYPVYLDIEDPSQDSIDKEVLFDMCRTFIERVQREGYFCGLYVSYNWLYNILNTDMTTRFFDVWLARWEYEETAWNVETMGERTGIWQYSDSGEIGTHTCKFDLNVAFKDYPTLIREWGLNGLSE